MPAHNGSAAAPGIAAVLVAGSILLGFVSAPRAPLGGGRPDRARGQGDESVASHVIATVRVTATDFVFAAPDTIPAGVVAVRLQNDGLIPHAAWLVRLERGRTLRELERELISRGMLPAWAADAGGPGPVAPAGESWVTLALVAGRHVMLSGERLADGSTAVMRGMYRAVDVVGPAGAGALPSAGATIELGGATIRVTGDFPPGRQRVRLVNHGTTTRELRIYRLRAGSDSGDLIGWLPRQEGVPPADVLGGVAGLAAGGSATIDLALAAGEYVLVDRVPPLRGAPAPPRTRTLRIR